MSFSPRLLHTAEPVLPNTVASSLDQYASKASANGFTAVLPVSTTALLLCTKMPRHEKFVDPQTTDCTFGPSTTIVLLCWSCPMCWRLTLLLPADTASRFAAAF